MTSTVTFVPPITALDKALFATLAGDTTIAPPAIADVAAIYFPASPAQARFPSPENEQIMVIRNAGSISLDGRPYLKDQDGGLHEIRIINRATGPEAQYFKNGQNFPVNPGELVGQCLVRQGNVYMQLAQGIWKHVDDNGTMYNVIGGLPPALTTTGPGGVRLPALPDLPIPMSPAPGTSGRIIQCGSGQATATLSLAILRAQPGDTIRLSPGTYTDTPPPWAVPLLIDLGGATFDATGKTAALARGKSLLCPAADSIIQNGTITGVAMDQPKGELTCAIRPDAGCGYLTIIGVTAHGNQCAVGHGGFPTVIAVINSDISRNGLTTNAGALTHNLYIGPECRRLTLTDVIANGATEGHSIKYRGPELIVNGGTFASAPGKPFDIPNGSTAPFRITEATIIKGPNDSDHGVLAYGEEGRENGLAGGTISGTIIANCANPQIITTGGTIAVSASILGGKITAVNGGVVTGI